ncbi:bifunctional adenosylcobinamide kinase/adenosylcobinamide-phosphate guanylyltransferase [Tenacibaculum finnmarkense]|uniref:bifunctional adenosylcobinamide kinase/adenosylcobinamide-phosphate guanylyltransferase n=2 Tax=Tenacibaculum finnmarkense TaxID=2781243 RepID=UPI001EFACBBB|nr:bifunctional adenosylcobinamide kinase/adenosylcobinamide-phosphate guanylyltransferase [Tenacibaculum finnmarkense]
MLLFKEFNNKLHSYRVLFSFSKKSLQSLPFNFFHYYSLLILSLIMMYYISGGERSGKSSYAQQVAESLSENPYYLATSRIWDADFKKRVNRHISDRDERWTTIEEEKNISNVIPKNATVVIDCVTLWLTNFYLDTKNDVQESLTLATNEIDKLLDVIAEKNATIIIISNEIGMGLHADTQIGRKFTELQGWVNQYIAKKADKATFIVSGLPLTLK